MDHAEGGLKRIRTGLAPYDFTDKFLLMKALIPGALAILMGVSAYGNWRVIHRPDGRAAEVSVDFEIKEISMHPTGLTRLELRSSVNEEAVGFQLEIAALDQNSTRNTGINNHPALPEFEIVITNRGELTRSLEAHLQKTFSDSIGDQPILLSGTYRGISSSMGTSLSHPSHLSAWGVLLPKDLDGNPIINGENFDIRLIIDAPFKRVIGYFSVPPGYGGSSSANWARKQWFEAVDRPAAPAH